MAGRRRDSNPFDDDEVNPFAVFAFVSMFLFTHLLLFVIYYRNLWNLPFDCGETCLESCKVSVIVCR